MKTDAMTAAELVSELKYRATAALVGISPKELHALAVAFERALETVRLEERARVLTIALRHIQSPRDSAAEQSLDAMLEEIRSGQTP